MNIEKIRELISEVGITPHALSVEMGVEAATMYRVLAGKQEPSLRFVKRLATVVADKTKRSRVNVLGAITGIEDYSWN